VQVQLIFEDGKSSGRDATSAAEKLIHIDKVDLLFGGNYSSEVLASAMISQPFQIVNLSAVAESPEINNVGEYVYKWLDSSFETTALSRYLLHQQVEKI
jgi:ABC-type branched-subunit amino acid transport system substrate-binding protein